MSLYIKTLKLKNYKCYANLCQGHGLTLNTPKWNNSKGLNIFIGDNNSGKTAVISALTKLRVDRSIVNDQDKYNEFRDVEIEIIDSEDKKLLYSSKKTINLIKDNSSTSDLDVKEIDIVKDNRVWKSDFSMSPGFGYEGYFSNFLFDRTETDYLLASRLNNLEQKNRRKIAKIIREIYPDFSSWEPRADKGKPYISYELRDNRYLSIDYSLGSGLLNLFRIALALVDHKDILVIDEPEAFLHPTAQIKLSKILARYTMKTDSNPDPMQIIISTHSPYMFQYPLQKKATLFIFEKKNGKHTITKAETKRCGLFGKISPTWGEINYYAYSLPTVEFHNELYGYLQQRVIKKTNDRKYSEEKYFDRYVGDLIDNTPGITKKMRIWRDDRFTPPQQNNRTLQTYIRNCIHHPENTLNTSFDDEELKLSTKQLILLIKNY